MSLALTLVPAPFVTLAGETSATATIAGSTNCPSRNCWVPASISSRMTSSADADSRASATNSSVSTMMPPAFAAGTVTDAKSDFVTGAGAP